MRFLALALSAFAVSAAVAEPVDIKEWLVPYKDSRPRDPFAESRDSVWFVGQKTSYLARLDAKTGAMEKVDLPDGAGPHNLIVDDAGIVWYAGNLKGYIGRFDPQTKEIEKIAMPDPAVRDPHTLIADAKGLIWFTAQGSNVLGRLDPKTRKVDIIPVATPRARPYGVKIAPDGAPWAVLFGVNKLARVDPSALTIEEIELPRAEARPRRLEITADGKVWYGDYAAGVLGVYDPTTKMFEEFLLPSGKGARPYATAADAAGRIWVFETGVQPNMLVGFDPKTKKFLGATPVPSGGGTVRHAHYHEPSGAVWFGTDTNYIGRAVVEPQKAQ